MKPALYIYPLIIPLLLSGCTLSSTPVAAQPTNAQVLPVAPASTPVIATDAPAAQPVESEPKMVESALPPEPQEITFQTTDGRELKGRYYPAAVSPAPLVVLMHWYPGDQEEWDEIAFWLQNRGLGGKMPNPANKPWLDASWFPAIPSGQSLAVFTFSFTGCDVRCREFVRDLWLIDAQSAMERARQLPGVDPNSIVAMGASIGADGALDGCVWLNEKYPNACLGSLSLSPGAYLTLDYPAEVAKLYSGQPSKPVWCLYGEGDEQAVVDACTKASGEAYRSERITGGEGEGHGLRMLTKTSQPDSMALILEFLKMTVGLQ